jgi:anti-sigma-K factor RskA
MEARIMSGGMHDGRLVQRYVDGELDGGARDELERRMLRDAALRALLASAAAPVAGAPAGFAARVLGEVRRLPSRAELVAPGGEPGITERELARTVAFARRLFVAAVLIGGLALLIWAGLLRRADSARVEAADRKALLDLQQSIEHGRRLRDADELPVEIERK